MFLSAATHMPAPVTRWLLAAMLVLFAVASASVAGCGANGDAAPAPRSGPIRVVCTVGMVADLVRNIGGPHVTVESLMGAGADPHLYKATSDDLKRLRAADVVFYNGLLLEGKMSDSLIQLGRSKPVFAVINHVDESLFLHPDGAEGHPDPHVWMDASLWAQCAASVCRSLSEFDPAHAPDYAANLAAYEQQLAALHAYGKKVIATIPSDARVLITSHDAFKYFSRAYHLEVQGVQGISTESEAGLKRVNDLVDLIVQRKIKAVFVESSVSPKAIEALVEGAERRGHKVVIGGELYSDAMGSEGTYEGTYVGMLDHNITLVARALGGAAPEKGLHGRLAAPR